MKKLFTFLLIALVSISVNAAGVVICGKVYNENSYRLINQELTDAGYLKSGSVAYDPVNYKLTLNNADILCDKTIIETYQLEELEIEVIGNCTLKTKKEGNETLDNALSCINVTAGNTKPMTIDFTGNGSLKMTSTNIAFFAFNRYSVQYKFDGPEVTIKAARGIWSTSVYRVAYKMNAGSLKIWSDYGAIDHAFNMDNGVYGTMSFAPGIKILEPYDGRWDCVLPQNGYAQIRHFAGEAKTVKIGSTYDLKVGGVQVTTQNCNDILGDGKVSYFQTNNFLTLNNATIETDLQVIVSDIQWLKIRLVGNNRLITHHNTYGIYLTECDGVAIEGAGNGVENDKLSMESTVNQVGIGYFTHKKGEPAQTYIRNCSITMPEGEIQNEDNDCALTIENAYIHLTDGYITTPPALTLNNCEIVKPQGGVINWSSVADANGGSYWGEIEIVPMSLKFGDVNRDGKVDPDDVSYLQQYLNTYMASCDLNGDGIVGLADMNMLINYLVENNPMELDYTHYLKVCDVDEDGFITDDDSSVLSTFILSSNGESQNSSYDVNGDNLIDWWDYVIVRMVVNAGVEITSYGVQVFKTTVTTLNYEDVLRDGTVSYDPETHTLTLNNANIAPVGESNNGSIVDRDNYVTYANIAVIQVSDRAIFGNYQTLNVRLIGENNIAVRDWVANNSQRIVTAFHINHNDVNIMGDGSLDISTHYGAQLATGAELKICDGAKVNFASYTAGIGIIGPNNYQSWPSTTATLTVDNAWLKVVGGTATHPIQRIAKIELIDAEYITPANAYYFDYDGTILDGDTGEYATTVEIAPTSTGLLGDVNGDGQVNVMDVTAVINHILGMTPDNFNMQAADVNSDGNINVMDVTGLINIILGVTSK